MRRDEYDAIVIGGGIGGLVCGCYLAKSGLKVLITEKNKSLGGYCTSFENRGYKFNTCVRGFVGGKPGGVLDRILYELGLKSKITILRSEVYDEIQFLGRSIFLHNDPRRTVDDIKKLFPSEASAIDNFFSLIVKEKLVTEFYRYRKYNFQQLIDENFKDEKLKFFLSILRIDSGMLPSQTSALADLMLVRGNVFDGGYFPKGGMQSLPNALGECLQEMGGSILLSSKVTKIKVNKHKAVGVFLENDNFLKSKVIISNADATFTYKTLLKDAKINNLFLRKISRMLPSASTFCLHLALNTSLKKYLKYNCCAIWNVQNNLADGLVCVLSSDIDSELTPAKCDSVTLYYGAPFRNAAFWNQNKEKFAHIFLTRFLKIFPDLKKQILFYEITTPYDFQKNTFNRDGASRGWAPTIQQTGDSFPSFETPINNVFMVGHWIASLVGNGGVTFVSAIGKRAAFNIKNRLGKMLK